jgi:hypothetical protein
MTALLLIALSQLPVELRFEKQAARISWLGIGQRCNNPKANRYENYGGRGVKVCERWKSFWMFLEDMGRRPSKKHSIDRIDVNGDYCPENCRWATAKQQMNNTRWNVILEIDGVSKNITQWSEFSGTNRDTIRRRVERGWDVRRAVFESALVCGKGVLYEAFGRSQTLTEWCKEFGISTVLVHYRMKRMSFEQSLTKPIRPCRSLGNPAAVAGHGDDDVSRAGD